MIPKRVREDFAVKKAKEFRNQLGFLGPVGNIEEIIKSRVIVEYSLQPSCSFVLWEKELGYVICIVPTQPERDRWTLVHEYAHIYLGHFKYSVNSLAGSVFYNSLSNRENYILEREADLFTAEFLMPGDLVYCLVPASPSLREIGKLKSYFGVSWEAMKNRLDDLGIVSKNDCNGVTVCL